MKKIEIHSKSVPKILKGEIELSKNDLTEDPKGLIPGEWVVFFNKSFEIFFVGFANPFAENFFNFKLIKKIDSQLNFQTLSEDFIKEIIDEKINSAISKRELFDGYESGSRLIYGIADNMPGVIVDKYKKYILVQINTAGFDRYREYIRTKFELLHPQHKVILWDNEEYRKQEVLPSHAKEEMSEDLEVNENNLNYLIPKEITQKIGYYYDHRENRLKLRNLVSRFNGKKDLGLDLFSYVGSWGLHLLSAGVKAIEFVDQGNMGHAIAENLKRNNYLDRGVFIRSDVFKFLDSKIAEKKEYDIVISDPPAFSKSEKNKANALAGYDKLHLKALRVTKRKGIFIAASCTHYISHLELDKSVQMAALKDNFRLTLVDIGVQGIDHPMKSLNDKSSYIKYLAYIVE